MGDADPRRRNRRGGRRHRGGGGGGSGGRQDEDDEEATSPINGAPAPALPTAGLPVALAHLMTQDASSLPALPVDIAALETRMAQLRVQMLSAAQREDYATALQLQGQIAMLKATLPETPSPMQPSMAPAAALPSAALPGLLPGMGSQGLASLPLPPYPVANGGGGPPAHGGLPIDPSLLGPAGLPSSSPLGAGFGGGLPTASPSPMGTMGLGHYCEHTTPQKQLLPPGMGAHPQIASHHEQPGGLAHGQPLGRHHLDPTLSSSHSGGSLLEQAVLGGMMQGQPGGGPPLEPLEPPGAAAALVPAAPAAPPLQLMGVREDRSTQLKVTEDGLTCASSGPRWPWPLAWGGAEGGGPRLRSPRRRRLHRSEACARLSGAPPPRASGRPRHEVAPLFRRQVHQHGRRQVGGRALGRARAGRAGGRRLLL